MVKVYYHISMMNNWEEIVKEQISLLVSSGLYDECESVSLDTEINIGTGVETSVMDVAIMVSDISHAQVVSIPERPIDKITRRCLDISKAEALLDWHPNVSVKEGIDLLWKNYR